MSAYINIPPGNISTVVRLAAPASALTFPVISGEALTPGRIRVVEITARLRSDGTSRVVTAQINGVGTNISSQYNSDIITAVAAARGAAGTAVIGVSDTYGCRVTLRMEIGKGPAGWKRFGNTTLTSSDLAGHIANTLYLGGIFYDDAATVITSIGFDVANATGLIVGTEGWITEYEL